MTWLEFLTALKAAGGSTDMQTSKTGRYPYLHHFLRGERLKDVVVYAYVVADGQQRVLSSPPRDWSTKRLLWADYASIQVHGGYFNDTKEALSHENT